jgi:hypothetical protein
MADNTAHADSSQQPTGNAAQPGMLQRFPVALGFCAILSVFFVVVVAALTAFMQYQARLLHAQPGITASQLVYYVDAEKDIHNDLTKLTGLSDSISKETPKFTFTRDEINFRIERICGLFDAEPSAKQQKDKCRRFLNEIPFKGTTETSGAENASTSSSDASGKGTEDQATSSADTISAKLLDSILANFTKFMNVSEATNNELSKIIPLFQSDMGTIAHLNQKYWLDIRPNYLRMLQEYSAKCQHIYKLIEIVSTYRTIDPGCDPRFNASIFMTDVSGQESPPEGGPIIPPQGGPITPPQGGPIQPSAPTSNLNGTQGEPAAALVNQGAAKKASTTGNAPSSSSTLANQPDNSGMANNAAKPSPQAAQSSSSGEVAIGGRSSQPHSPL